ncbi:MAG: hypothetical protein ACRYHB_05310 [Janthinobacterium lividum]
MIAAVCMLQAHAQTPQKAVEIACALENGQQGTSLWSTRTLKRESGHLLEYRRLETVDGILEQLVHTDGHAPDGPERAKSDAILHDLLTDASARTKAAETARADEARLKATISLIPVMFTFQDKASDGTTRVLTFVPNDAYKPKSFEERALHSLAGEVRIDVHSQRLKAFDAVVSDTVKFGFGLLGSISKGGTVHLQFSEVAPGIWKTSSAKLNVDGHIALVKSLSKTEDTERVDFQRLPADFTILQALSMMHVSR